MKSINKISLASLLLISALTIVVSCNKNKSYATKEADGKVHFVGADIQSYKVEVNPPPPYTVTIGTTDVSDKDRTVSFAVSSPTGLVAGTDYTLGVTGNTLTIPAGQATATFTVLGNYNSFTNGQKDTLVIVLKEPSTVEIANFSDTLLLAMRGPCFEGDFDANAFSGTFANTNEVFGTSPYGPYTTTITPVTLLTPTTGKITVTNIWDFGWGPIDFILDWTNPSNRTVVPVAATSGIADAGTISGSYAGSQVAVRPFAGQPGTFSFCNGTIVLKMQLGVAGLGYFGQLYTVTPRR